jgi:hypothetical protein
MLCRDIVEKRLVVHVYRELRRKQLKLDKGKGSGAASVSLTQLKKSFPSISNYEITTRLRDHCECQHLPVWHLLRKLQLISPIFLPLSVSQIMPACTSQSLLGKRTLLISISAHVAGRPHRGPLHAETWQPDPC